MPAKTQPTGNNVDMGSESGVVTMGTSSPDPSGRSGNKLLPGDVPNSISDKRLKYFNIAAGILHFVQGLLMLVASQAVTSIKSFGQNTKITIRYMDCLRNATTGDCQQFENGVRLKVKEDDIGSMEIGAMAAVFLLLSAVAHLLVVIFFKRYIADINRGINVFRWYEYSLSSSVMIVAIGALFGLKDLASIFLLFFVNMVMNLFGLLMERMNMGVDKENVNWEAFNFGTIAGIAPWIAICLYFFAGPLDLIPGFVYAIFFCYLVFFMSFAVNMFLQYKRVGPWKNYRFGEVTYQILSLVSKSLLAYLVFGGTFQPNSA